MEILVGGVVLVTSLVLGNDPYEDPAKYAVPAKPAPCYSYGGSGMRTGYGSGIAIYHCPSPAPTAQREVRTTTRIEPGGK